MSQPSTERHVHERWSSSGAFLLAAVGAAVGLGNIWRFPYIAGENGGGAFVLIYLGCIVFIGVPLMMAELLMGRRGRQSPVATMGILAREAGQSQAWKLAGWLGLITPLLAITFYGVVAGWAMSYVFKTASGEFTGAGAEGAGRAFQDLMADPWTMMLWHGVFMALTVFFVARGVRKGLERAVKLMMPVLFVILLLLLAYVAAAADFAAGFRFLFEPDFSKITAGAVLMAIGQAFFSLAVAVGALITYGAYLPEGTSLPRAAWIIAAVDTGVAILAGLIIFPLVFTYGLAPAEGPPLIFLTLPIAFGQMPAGALFGTLFFILLVFAALTSSISMLEPFVCWAEEHKGWRRAPVTFITGGVAWAAGLGAALSFNVLEGFKPLSMFAALEHKTIFGLLDYLTANLFMPVAGILIAVFAGWVMSRQTTCEELGLGDGWAYGTWRFLVRFVVPLAIAWVFWENLN